jgi:hypothetical protein
MEWNVFFVLLFKNIIFTTVLLGYYGYVIIFIPYVSKLSTNVLEFYVTFCLVLQAFSGSLIFQITAQQR